MRGSRTVLREPRGAIPRGYSPGSSRGESNLPFADHSSAIVASHCSQGLSTLRKISLLCCRQINERRNYTVHVRGTGATWFSVAVPSWSASFIVVSRDSSRAVFSIKTLTARFLPNTAIVPCRRMVISLSTFPSVFEFAAVTTPKLRGCQGVRFSILMLPNRGLGFNGTKGLLINLYLMPLWVMCLGNLNRHWVNRQSLLDFLVNGQEEKGTRVASRGRDAAVPAMGQTRRSSWRLGQIRGQGTSCSCEWQAGRASAEEVKAKKKAAALGP